LKSIFRRCGKGPERGWCPPPPPNTHTRRPSRWGQHPAEAVNRRRNSFIRRAAPQPHYPVAEYKHLIGRAGRRGCKSQGNVYVTTRRTTEYDVWQTMDRRAEDARSQLFSATRPPKPLFTHTCAVRRSRKDRNEADESSLSSRTVGFQQRQFRAVVGVGEYNDSSRPSRTWHSTS